MNAFAKSETIPCILATQTYISIEKVFFSQQLRLRYGTICGSVGEFVNCAVRKDGTMGTMEHSAHGSLGTHMWVQI